MRLCCQILDAKPHRKSQIASIAPSASLYTRRFFFRSMQHTGLGSGLRGPPASTCILNREEGAATNSQIHDLGQRTATSLLGVVSKGHRTRNCGGPRTSDGGTGGTGLRSSFSREWWSSIKWVSSREWGGGRLYIIHFPFLRRVSRKKKC
jgi:hypothetical protein